jgi:hypothetical protein
MGMPEGDRVLDADAAWIAARADREASLVDRRHRAARTEGRLRRLWRRVLRR